MFKIMYSEHLINFVSVCYSIYMEMLFFLYFSHPPKNEIKGHLNESFLIQDYL